ncbi:MULTISPECIES: DUF6894 family protein [unclassified Methylobacterium]|uniref:DUF6894 family protein n=1 Tax=unclassified Methylobacterium TaxID=2615210 RepID=UPI001FBA332D|nr:MULTISPECIES: hypothetical protein [unclassified Methylobacterium]MCJ2093089.1 hypothetical protein [Methylobacterium sp. J-072]MCJ2123425.1 hypothetical protein [Methylobacterium sp. J-077]
MPHFFFDTDDGNFRNVDSEGFELSGIEAARIEALDALPDMARNRLPDGDRRTYSVRVRDEDGRVIYFASLDLVGEWHIPHATNL